MKYKAKAIAVSAAVVFASLPFDGAKGAVIVTIINMGDDLFVSGSGNLNITSLSSLGVSSLANPFMNTDRGLRLGSPAAALILQGATPLGSFAAASTVLTASSGSGDLFGLVNGEVDVPENYVSGNPLNGSATFFGRSIASLGLIPGTYVSTWGSGGSADSFTLVIVPEPSCPMLIGVGAIWILGRRARRNG